MCIQMRAEFPLSIAFFTKFRVHACIAWFFLQNEQGCTYLHFFPTSHPGNHRAGIRSNSYKPDCKLTSTAQLVHMSAWHHSKFLPARGGGGYFCKVTSPTQERGFTKYSPDNEWQALVVFYFTCEEVSIMISCVEAAQHISCIYLQKFNIWIQTLLYKPHLHRFINHCC